MKKSIIYLGIALLGFGTLAHANNQHIQHHETGIYAKLYSTPLCVAISKGETEIVKKFIAYGADVNEKTNGLTPLMYAARYNQVDIIKVLIDNGADVKIKDEKGFTALDHAENSKATNAVNVLKNFTMN